MKLTSLDLGANHFTIGTNIMKPFVMPASELLAKHAELFQSRHLVIAGAMLDSYPLALSEQAEQSWICSAHFGQTQGYTSLAKTNTKVIFSACPKLEQPADTLLLYMPKAKLEAAYWLAVLLPQLTAGADLFIVGENRGGVRSSPNLLKEFGLTTQKLDSARRCSLYHAELTQVPKAVDTDSWQQTYQLNLPQGVIQVASMPGVFNHGSLDKGTELLLKHLPTLTGRGLDFGCGAGILATAIATQSDAEMTLVDISAFALESSETTLKLNQLNGTVLASDGLSYVSGQFDFMVTNPPFHEGIDTHYETTERFFAEACEHIVAGGQLWIVANSFLRYEPILEAHFSQCNRITDNGKFRIYQCIK